MKQVLKTSLMVIGGMWVISFIISVILRISGFRAENQQIQSKTKIAAFSNVEQLRKTLSRNGIGELRQWHADEPECWSSSDYFPFGGESSENGMQNNLAYYLESEKAQFVRQLKLMLNVNNKAENAKALVMYSDIVEKTFKCIDLELPKDLLESCKLGKDFKSDQSQFLVTSELNKSKINTWKLTIQTK